MKHRCDACGGDADRLLIDLDNITYRSESTLPVRYCEGCFGRLPGKGSDEFDRIHRRAKERMKRFNEHLATCKGEDRCGTCQGAMFLDPYGHVFLDSTWPELFEFYSIEGVPTGTQSG